MNQVIQGTYKSGTVLLDRLPEGVTEARVVVEFVDPPTRAQTRGGLKFGMFAKADRPFTSDQDIDAAKRSWNPADGE